MSSPFRLIAAGALLASLLSTPTAVASDAVLVLDTFSVFRFEGTTASAMLPVGGRIPLNLAREAEGSWSVRIAASAFDFPPVTYPSGKSVKWRLSSDATGQLTNAAGGARLDLSAPLVAYVDGASRGIPFPMSFTTESSSAARAGVSASVRGVKVDAASGFVQLVATGISPDGAATAPGKPFYAILSGQISGLPSLTP